MISKEYQYIGHLVNLCTAPLHSNITKDDTSSHVTCAATVNEHYLAWAGISRAKSTCRDINGAFKLYLGDNRGENINVQHLNAYVRNKEDLNEEPCSKLQGITS